MALRHTPSWQNSTTRTHRVHRALPHRCGPDRLRLRLAPTCQADHAHTPWPTLHHSPQHSSSSTNMHMSCCWPSVLAASAAGVCPSCKIFRMKKKHAHHTAPGQTGPIKKNASWLAQASRSAARTAAARLGPGRTWRRAAQSHSTALQLAAGARCSCHASHTLSHLA
jgi:hypothetical protein